MSILANTYREKTKKELEQLLRDVYKKIAVERLRELGSQSKNTHIVSQLRRSIAVIKTFMRISV